MTATSTTVIGAVVDGPAAPQIETIAADRLEGCAAIGEFLGRSERETRWQLERGLWPCWREGAKWVASKAAMRRHWIDQTAAPIDPAALAREREAKNLARRRRAPSMPAITMEGAPKPLRRRRISGSPSPRQHGERA